MRLAERTRFRIHAADLEHFERLLLPLRDHATYLGVDLNQESLAGLRDELATVQGAAAQL